MVYIYIFVLTAFRSTGLLHENITCCLLEGYLPTALEKGLAWAFYDNPYNAWGLSMNAQTIQLECHRQLAREQTEL